MILSPFRPLTAAAPLALAAALLCGAPARAQTGDAPPPQASPATDGARVYLPEDFARYAPKTAFEMLARVPGFSIRQADLERGLGQASENVLVNGQRIANKSGGAVDQLQKTAASAVVRIEIVDGSALGIAGLSGQVANVIVSQDNAASGQFEWRPDIRAHYAKPNWLRGNVSWSGKAGAVGYTLSVEDQTGRGGFGGPIVLTDPAGAVIETREQVFHSEADLVTFKAKLSLDGPGSSEGNLTLGYTPYWNPSTVIEQRHPVGGVDSERRNTTRLAGWYYDVTGDYAFPVGPGRLKLIGLRHWDKEPVISTQRTRFADGSPDEGVRFVRDSRIAETVLRAEYGWKGGPNDWQLSLERAYNALNQKGGLFTLDPAGDFIEIPFPEGSGHVVETRYEGIATWSRALGAKLDLQVAGGAEISKLARIDGDIPPREFVRPKGSITLGWRPAPDWDLSLKANRRVGQISFYDFLDQPNLQQERENSGNPDLVPPQSWELEAEVGKSLGPWGKTRLKLYRHWIEDIVDIIPIGDDGQGVGNLPRATVAGAEWTSTFQLDPVGVAGAKLDLVLQLEDSSVRDPLSGKARPISGNLKTYLSVNFRHDIPDSDWAWGTDWEHFRPYRRYYLSEVADNWEGPWFTQVYVENKDVFGLTVRATVNNILNARHRNERDIYDGRRLRDPLLYHQSQDQLIGPIFSLKVSGNF